MADETARDHRSDVMEAKFKRGRDPEIAAAAPDGPEQVWVFVLARSPNAAVGGDQLHGRKIVERQTVLAHQPSDTAAERQASDPGRRHHSSGGGQAVQLRLTVEL